MPSPKVTEALEAIPSNTPLPTFSKSLLICTSFKLEHFANALVFSIFKLFGSTIFFKLVHPLKEPSPISFTVFAMFTCAMPVLLKR